MKIKVNDKIYQYFDSVSINTSLTAVASTFTFLAYYDPDNDTHKEIFLPLSFPRVQFFDDDDTLLSTGTLVHNDMTSSAEPSLAQASGYSVGGIMEDCTIPYSAYPLESNNQSLKQIATRFLKLLGVNLIVYDIVKAKCDEIIEKSVATPEQTVKEYLTKIAAQKNVIISHDIYGNVIMFRPDIKGEPKLRIQPENGVSMRLSVNGQAVHSELTSIRQPTKGDGSNAFEKDYSNLTNDPDFPTGDTSKSFKVSSVTTIKNPLVKAYRPSVDVLSSGTFYDTDTAVKQRRAKELENISIEFSMAYWPKISIGDIIEVYNPEIRINQWTRFVLSTTNISEDAKEKTMRGTLVLPETFTGEVPKNPFS